MATRQAESARARYRALVDIDYPTDPDVIRRILAGATVPDHARKARFVRAGDVVDDIPSVSVASLLSQGQIEPADGAVLTPRRGGAPVAATAPAGAALDDALPFTHQGDDDDEEVGS